MTVAKAFAKPEVLYVVGPPRHPGWTDVWRGPDKADRIAQALIGDAVEVRRTDGAASLVRCSANGQWEGWVDSACLKRPTEGFLRALRTCSLVVITRAPGITDDNGFMLPFGSVLPACVAEKPNSVLLMLPTGRTVGVDASAVTTAPHRTLQSAIRQAQGFRGVRYQIGGNTVDAVDGPGLVYLAYRAAGVCVPRDVHGLMESGTPVSPEAFRAGDVVFFPTVDPDRPHPVMLLDAGATYIEAAPAAGVATDVIGQMKNRPIIAARRYWNASEEFSQSEKLAQLPLSERWIQ